MQEGGCVEALPEWRGDKDAKKGGVPGRGRARGAKEMTHAPTQKGVRGNMEKKEHSSALNRR